jgi:two-component system chemotaxis response regulator CheY
MLRLLIADESEAIRKIASQLLGDLGFRVTASSSTLDAFAKAQAALPDVVIVDSAMTGALELIANIRALPNGYMPNIYYSLTKADLRCLMNGKRAGANDFLLKPFDRKVLSLAFAEMIATAAA